MSTIEAFCYAGNPSSLREKLKKAAQDQTTMGRVWNSVKRRARTAPDAFPWFAPFAALVTGESQDIESAKRQIARYVSTLDAQEFGMGVQFHFWCFAFPHARWSLYFKWLDQMGAWKASERAEILERLALFQFTNFFFGMRNKPEPECVDNQTLSLCFSNALFGHLFHDEPAVGAMARRMAEDGFRRLPATIGGFPPSGYSGEGSTYMDYVVGPAMPFVCELLEMKHGRDFFSTPLPPNGGSVKAVLKMLAREWTPSGLLLPWDHYGFSLPVRSAIAYAAHKTGDDEYLELLERADWGAEQSIGWGYDDLPWTLLWWPDVATKSSNSHLFKAWAEKDVGGSLSSPDGSLHLVQIWDKGSPKTPIREHVNPNILLLSAYGSPLTIDGIPAKDCHRFDFAETALERAGMDFNPIKTNFGPGCAGAHGSIIVDGYEALRPIEEYMQSELLEFSPESGTLSADVTPLYKERWPDAIAVRRKSRLCEGSFWIIEDLAAFKEAHEVSARWILRPEQLNAGKGIEIETAEGVRLAILPLLGPDAKSVERVKGFPERLDCESLIVDFKQSGALCRWLWLAFPYPTREAAMDFSEGWQVIADPSSNLDFASSVKMLQASEMKLPLDAPPYFFTETAPSRTWWHAKSLPCSADRRWLRLPRGLLKPRVWLDGNELDLKGRWKLAELLPIDIEIPSSAKPMDIILRTDAGDSQYGEHGKGGASFYGKASLLKAANTDIKIDASFNDGRIAVSDGKRSWSISHELMRAEA